MKKEVKFIPSELLQAVKNIPIQNVLFKFFKDMEYKKDRSSSKFEVYKNSEYTAYLNPVSNDVTIKENATGKTWIGGADTIGLVQRAKFWDYWDSENIKYASRKETFKKSVLWLAKEFNLIKEIKDGKIKLDLKEIQVIESANKQIKDDFLYKIELQAEKLKTELKLFENKQSLKFDKNFRGIDKKLMGLLINNGSCKLFKNPEKGNREELKIALKDAEGYVQGIQTLYYNIYEKRWDKRNVGDAQVSWFGNKNASNVIITESFMDSASAAQVIASLKNMDYSDVLNNYLFISVNGQYSNLKKETIKRFLTEGNIKKVILAHDNDKAGESFDKKYLKNGEFYELVKDKNLVVFKPKETKDFNDFIRGNDFKTENFKDSLIMQKAEDYYKEYLREMEIEEALEKEAVLNNDPGEKVEEKSITDVADAEVVQEMPEMPDVVESAKSTNSPALSGNVKLSEILDDLMESKTVNNKTNYFYKVNGESVKFARFTPRLKGFKKGIYGVFFKEDDYVEVDKKGKEKGSGISILYGKNLSNLKNLKNVVLSTSITDALKLLKVKNMDISDSIIIAVKSAGAEAKIVFEETIRGIEKYGPFRVKNIFIVDNDKKTGKFLNELLANEQTYYWIEGQINQDYPAYGYKKANLEIIKEEDLKDIKLEMDILDTAPGKAMERENPKKEKEPVLSV